MLSRVKQQKSHHVMEESSRNGRAKSLFVAGAKFGEVEVSLFLAGAAFGEVQVSLFVAGAAFGEVELSFFVAGAVFREIWNDSRSAKCCIFQYKMLVVGVKSNLGCEAGCIGRAL